MTPDSFVEAMVPQSYEDARVMALDAQQLARAKHEKAAVELQRATQMADNLGRKAADAKHAAENASILDALRCADEARDAKTVADAAGRELVKAQTAHTERQVELKAADAAVRKATDAIVTHEALALYDLAKEWESRAFALRIRGAALFAVAPWLFTHEQWDDFACRPALKVAACGLDLPQPMRTWSTFSPPSTPRDDTPAQVQAAVHAWQIRRGRLERGDPEPSSPQEHTA